MLTRFFLNNFCDDRDRLPDQASEQIQVLTELPSFGLLYLMPSNSARTIPTAVAVAEHSRRTNRFMLTTMLVTRP